MNSRMKKALKKEGEFQFAYEERVAMTLSTAERFLEERKGEPPSVFGSDIGSEVGDEKIAEGDGITEEAIEREIASMRASLEDNSRRNAVGNIHIDRDLGQNSLHAGRFVARETREDEWIGQEKTLPRRPQGQVNLPLLRLEPFDGDCTKWPEFSAGFKALIHDVVQTDYQTMAYLRMYLTPEIRSSNAGLLTQPSHYHEALQVLKSRYGHPGLLAKANTALITSLPVVKPGLNDVIAYHGMK